MVHNEVPGGIVSPGLRFSRKNHGIAHRTGSRNVRILSVSDIEEEEDRTPNASGKCNQDAESLCVIFCAFIRLETLQNSHHDGKDDNFADGADCE